MGVQLAHLLAALPAIAAEPERPERERDLARLLIAQARRPDWQPKAGQVERLRLLARRAADGA